jgi:surface protein
MKSFLSTRKSKKKLSPGTFKIVDESEAYSGIHQTSPLRSSSRRRSRSSSRSAKKILNDGNIKNYVSKYINEMRKIRNKRNTHNETQLQPIGRWDVSNVTNMKDLFKGYTDFNEDISRWDVSNVTNMESMFEGCTDFNNGNNIYGLTWITSNVENMKNMFKNCSNFDQRLLSLNTSKVTDMESMFEGCTRFNKPLRWDTSNVENMRKMFKGCILFDQRLNWNTSKVTDMESMFKGCGSFDQDLGSWDTSQVTTMDSMFQGCRDFNNGGLRTGTLNWNVSNVANMKKIFQGCTLFRKDLSAWNITRAFNNTNVQDMFEGCHYMDRNQYPEQVRPEPTRRANARNTPRSDGAFEVHNAVEGIDYDKVANLLKEQIPSSRNSTPPVSRFGKYITDKLNEIINHCYQDDSIVKTQKQDESLEVMNMLKNMSYIDKPVNALYYALEFTSVQNTDFQTLYIDSFIFDCIHAYDYTGRQKLTCGKGGWERIISSLIPACKTQPDDANYKLILIELVPIKELIQKLTQDWFMDYGKNKGEKFKEVLLSKTSDDRRNELINYLTRIIPLDKHNLIEENIVGYDFDDDGSYTSFYHLQKGGKKSRRKTYKISFNKKSIKNHSIEK